MTKTVAYHWRLRKVMNEHNIHSTTRLVPLLFDCTPNDLIEPYVVSSSTRGRKAAAGTVKAPGKLGGKSRPTRAVIKPADSCSTRTCPGPRRSRASSATLLTAALHRSRPLLALADDCSTTFLRRCSPTC